MRDLDGKTLPSIKAARGYGIKSCGELIRDLDGDLQPECEWRMEVADEKGSKLFSLRFKAECYLPTSEPMEWSPTRRAEGSNIDYPDVGAVPAPERTLQSLPAA